MPGFFYRHTADQQKYRRLRPASGHGASDFATDQKKENGAGHEAHSLNFKHTIMPNQSVHEKRLIFMTYFHTLLNTIFSDDPAIRMEDVQDNIMRDKIYTKQEIFDLLNQSRSRLRALGVKRIGLFGSLVRGEQRADSDVDILVEFEPRLKTFDNFMALSFFLEDILQSRIDLVTMESLSPYIVPRILSEVEYAPIAT
jgi:predicted nucleotidyltransferase